MRLAALVALVVWGSVSFGAVGQEPTVQPGTIFVLSLSGDVALAYGRLDKSLGANEPAAGLEIQVLALAERIDKGKVRIRHETIRKEDGQKDRLVVLTADIDSKRFDSTTSPKGTVIYSSPSDLKNGLKGKKTTEDSRGFKLTLKDPKEVTLRAWVAE